MSTFFWSEQKPSQAFSNLKNRFNAKGIFLKKRCPACQGYPAEARQLAHFVVFSPPPLPPPPPQPAWDGFAIPMWAVGSNLKRNKFKVTSARVTRAEGCLEYPRSHIWFLRLNLIQFLASVLQNKPIKRHCRLALPVYPVLYIKSNHFLSAF